MYWEWHTSDTRTITLSAGVCKRCSMALSVQSSISFCAPGKGDDIRRYKLRCYEGVCLAVCMYGRICPHAFSGTISTKFSVRVTCGCGSVLHWRRCDMFCTSGVVDDVMFAQVCSGMGDAKRVHSKWLWRILKLTHYGATPDRSGVWCLGLPCFSFYTFCYVFGFKTIS